MLDQPVKNLSELPLWNFDGSSTGQAPGHDSEVILKFVHACGAGGRLTRASRPIRIFPDPFRGGDNILVLSETYKPEGNGIITPLNHLPTQDACGVTGNNTRYEALKVFNNPTVAAQKPWFGIEQEYVLLDHDDHPLGWPKKGYPAPQGPYYCSVGAGNAIGRAVVEDHVKACLVCCTPVLPLHC